MKAIAIAPGVTLWRERFDRAAQLALLDEIMQRVEHAPFYRPQMPGSGALFSVEETNLGTLGWVSDRNGYRYDAHHPLTGVAWPAIPQTLLDLWNEMTAYRAPPECCLVNLYRRGARMGLHQDRDEQAEDAPVLSVSLGDAAIFRIGGTTRKGSTQSVKLSSGDVLTFGGPARRAFHGIDRIVSGSSTLIPGGGRINLTLRRVTVPK
ncbi:MAG TPA: alpha-ketoglutarate-dependent dioxygenase AlkB [Rhizomicrobium sp.]|nr:alpha-ketoglutarate-dependent dioxygenase AlkB [Rhizomicrobium sp.]